MSCSCSVVPFVFFVPGWSLRCPKRRAGVSTAADAATCRESAFKRPDPVPAIYVVPRTTGIIHSKLCHFFVIFIFTPHVLFPNHKCCARCFLIHDCSVNSCCNTPCFRCRLPGHRAKDCTNRRWPKDMCWRCLRTDRYKILLQMGTHAIRKHPFAHSLMQPLAMGMQSCSSSHANSID